DSMPHPAVASARSSALVASPEIVPLLDALLHRQLAELDAAGADIVHDVRLSELHALTPRFLRGLFGEQFPALLARNHGWIGGHVGGFHLAFGRGDVLDPLARQILLLRALADGEGLGPLQAAFLRNGRAHWHAALLQHAGDPVSDATERRHLPVLERCEGAAIVEEPADIRADAHCGIMHPRTAGAVDVIRLVIARKQAYLAQVGQVPV